MTPLETKILLPLAGGKPPQLHLFFWFLLTVTGRLFWDIEAEPSVGWILSPD